MVNFSNERCQKLAHTFPRAFLVPKFVKMVMMARLGSVENKLGQKNKSWGGNSSRTRPAASHSIPLSTPSPIPIRINKWTN